MSARWKPLAVAGSGVYRGAMGSPGRISHRDGDWFLVEDHNTNQIMDSSSLPGPPALLLRLLHDTVPALSDHGFSDTDTAVNHWQGRMWVTIDLDSDPVVECARADLTFERWWVAGVSAGCALVVDHPYLTDIAVTEINHGRFGHHPTREVERLAGGLLKHAGVRTRFATRHDRHRRAASRRR